MDRGMKATLFALFVGLLLVGCGEQVVVVDWSKIQDRGGVVYLQNEEIPFTGTAEDWYEDGQKRFERHYKDGKLMSAEVWKPNGEYCLITNLKDGKNT